MRDGAFCLGAALTPSGVRLVFGVGGISIAPGPGAAVALERGLEVVRLAEPGGEVGDAARRALAGALAAGWRRQEDGPSIIEAVLGSATLTAEVIAMGPSGAGAVTVGGEEITVQAVNPAMLEALVVGMRGMAG